ncbi:hypothetical protein ACGFX8_37020, partial [Streptomyces sp. NPDC048362]|uniref:hypothetical protein n=1 Tax=Streptomyces sp. NPDC048362 TaxID=3365539 RepID=UPI00372237B6
THPLGLSSGLPFGVSDSIRSFLDPISSVLSRLPLSRFPFQRFRLYQKFLAGSYRLFILSNRGDASPECLGDFPEAK